MQGQRFNPAFVLKEISWGREICLGALIPAQLKRMYLKR